MSNKDRKLLHITMMRMANSLHFRSLSSGSDVPGSGGSSPRSGGKFPRKDFYCHHKLLSPSSCLCENEKKKFWWALFILFSFLYNIRPRPLLYFVDILYDL